MDLPVPAGYTIEEYRRNLAAAPFFLRARRFVAADSWSKATTQDGIRYLGLFREHEPDLNAILTHPRLLILGEPGSGKSTTCRAIVQHLLEKEPTAIPVIASLKSYHGNLRNLLVQTVPAAVLDPPIITRTYILDGIDEIPLDYRAALPRELNSLLTTDATARLILTSRQAFAAQHPDSFPTGLTTYHLLEFDDEDIKACTNHHGVNIGNFQREVHDAECDEEIRNPFVLTVMLEQYQAEGRLSRLRSENVGYVVGRLIQSRPFFNATRQQRALRMLAVTCETAARNELTEDEALRVLLEAIAFTPDTARQLLDELSQSILIRTPGGISFQMRSYGEYLAAEELHDKTVDRLKELAFIGDTPVDTWENTVTYLAEMNDKIRGYFANHHPAWLINVSPSAFSEDERTKLARKILQDINRSKTYLVDQERLNPRRLSRLLTPAVIADVTVQRTSAEPHEVANALILLGILREPGMVPQALELVTAHRSESTLRYSAIIALINIGENSIINDLIAFADQTDPYYISIIDTIGSLCTPADFPSVLPLLERTNAGLSSAYYHFRELNTEEALIAAIAYLTGNPRSLDGHDLDSYLEPIIDLIPTHWDEEIGTNIGVLLANAERQQLFLQREKLPTAIIKHVAAKDHEALVIQAMIRSLAADGRRLHHTCYLISPLITVHAAQWINQHAPQYGQDVFPWLTQGPARYLLDPRSPDVVRAHEEAIAAQIAQEQGQERAATSTRTHHQHTLQNSRDINRIIGAAERLQKEHWPDLSAEQRDWLAQAVSDTLGAYDLGRSVTWENDNRLTHPGGLNPLLYLTDYYRLHLTNDVPIILGLRSWPYEAISNYYRREGLSPAAQEQLTNLLQTAENQNITNHVLSFLRQTGYNSPEVRALLQQLARNTTKPAQVRTEAAERLGIIDPAPDTFLVLAADQEPTVKEQAFRELVKRQHRGTIQRALATLTDDDLRNGEVPIPNNTPLDWIGKITGPFAVGDLKVLRLRSLELNLWRVTTLLTGTIANIDRNCAAAVISRQLLQTPVAWQSHYRQEAEKLERAARIEAIQQTPFDAVIRKLKGATSMIRIKVWCEGSTDRLIFRKLFNELAEHEIADTLDFVGGWANLLSEHEPERWLDGCRQAVVIMDGDNGRQLARNNQPLTNEAEDINRRFATHPLKLRVLRRYGIENYFPRHACEIVIQRDLTHYFPIPIDKKIEDHFCDPPGRTFYQKRLNGEIANHLTIADIEETDLGAILTEVKERSEEARSF